MSLFRRALAAMLFLTLTATAQQTRPDTWRDLVQKRLSLFGAGNWVVIADAAFPLHSGPGIETIDSDLDQISTVRAVLALIRRSRNLRPVAFTPLELARVPEGDAVGIGAYRQELLSFVKDSAPPERLNNQFQSGLLRHLDEVGRTFSVLVVKTNTLLPYSSVFIELQPSYWSDEAEQRLRLLLRP